ncbi:MAG: tyrosine-type recombinase/integrase [Youngiibacter sp.]|nr:tyrosine-type recombinase/integrase [Youngiibacter sp.]
MTHDEVIVKILSKTTLAMPETDQGRLRTILESVLSDYDITPMTRALAVRSDMPDHIAMYLATKQLDGHSKATIHRQGNVLRIFSEWVPLNVRDVTLMDIRKFLAQYSTERNLKMSSLDGYQSVIRTFFTWLENEDYIEKSPGRKLKAMKVDKRTRKALTSTELEMLREDGCKTSRDRALLEMFFSTGGRLSEITQLDIDKIDWSNNCVSIIGKGNKERMIYFTDKTKIYLKRYIMDRGILDHQALFVGERLPHARLGSRAIEKIIGQLGVNANLGKPIYPHLLRHTMATLGYKAGIPLPVIQELLGHEDASTTQIYAEIDKETVKFEHRKHMNQ